jgi:prepilin-type N-terminal cleavage/methylation domain-containing protein
MLQMKTKNKNYLISKKGFTLTEMTTALAISTIVVLAIGTILADNQRSFNRLYDKTFSDINLAGIIASRTFETTIRKAKGTTLKLGTTS